MKGSNYLRKRVQRYPYNSVGREWERSGLRDDRGSFNLVYTRGDPSDLVNE